eukprot:scaffold63802_cov63-Phaeocystis_antarctica.AAC.1
MAKDPAVSSIEVDCLQRHLGGSQRANMSPPESDNSSPGDHDMDQEAAARRLSVQANAPWNLDHTDGIRGGYYKDGGLTGKGVRVYIVDTGVQDSHGDFRASVGSLRSRVVEGYTVRAAPVAACTHPLPLYRAPAPPPPELYPLPSPAPRGSGRCTAFPTPPSSRASSAITARTARPPASAELSTANSPPTAVGATGMAPTWHRSSVASSTASPKK